MPEFFAPISWSLPGSTRAAAVSGAAKAAFTAPGNRLTFSLAIVRVRLAKPGNQKRYVDARGGTTAGGVQTVSSRTADFGERRRRYLHCVSMLEQNRPSELRVNLRTSSRRLSQLPHANV
jgi:hypothetical protein